MKTKKRRKQPETRAVTVGRALRRAAKTARKTARAYGTPIYIWRDGKVVAEKP
ncbi:MAG: hypothetical protein NTX53_06055 [candidate division WOR-3 bacterium]|nr:hypothetical protein [candidate division WOR-3 bacterium]